MRVLVVAASRHGCTREIGAAIAAELAAAGLDAAIASPAEVDSLEGVDALVLGSPVYMSNWLEPARSFISRHGEQLRRMPLWAFSVGLAGLPADAVADPREISLALLSVNPIDHQKFAGRLELSQLDLRERSIARLAGASEGDRRDWELIRGWARQMAEDLQEHALS